MDTVTQAVLGGAIGEAAFRDRLGGRAVVFGAACGLLPDLDVLTRVAGEWASLVYHRGSTHSLIVLPLAAPLLGALGARIFGGRERFWTWTHLAFWALVTHPLLDLFTSYGTQLLAPVSRARFSLDGVAIIDPFYTVPLIVAVVLAARRSVDRARSRRVAQAALAFGVLYLGAGVALTSWAAGAARAQLEARGVEVEALRAPTPIAYPVLRRVVARDAQGRLHVGTWSLLAPDDTRFEVLVSDDGPRVRQALESEQGRIMRWFSDGYLLARAEGDRVRLEDQRYGLFSDVTWTPFAAVAHFDGEGRLESVTRAPRPGRPKVSAELAAGWRALWAERSAQDGREKDSLRE